MALSDPNPNRDRFISGPPPWSPFYRAPQQPAEPQPEQEVKPEMILHCEECKNPVVAGWCVLCGYAPSMQDTYLAPRQLKPGS